MAAARGPPYKADNLPELLQLILTKKPDVPIKMARQADWMMCGPCPSRVAKLNACVNVLGSGGLSNEKRDLDMLQKLGLNFGSVMPARKLYQLIFERIPDHAGHLQTGGQSVALCLVGRLRREQLQEGKRKLREGAKGADGKAPASLGFQLMQM